MTIPPYDPLKAHPRAYAHKKARYRIEPYCLQHIDYDRWMVLNRDYGAVGTITLTEDILEGIGLKLSYPHEEQISLYLYNDMTSPWHSAQLARSFIKKANVVRIAMGIPPIQ